MTAPGSEVQELKTLTLDTREGFKNPAAGIRLGQVRLSRAEWMHRRTDTYRFVDAKTVRVTMNFHVTIPQDTLILKGEPGHQQSVVPIMLLDKSILPYGFRVCDAQGKALPRLLDDECSLLEFHFLEFLAQTICGGPISDSLTRELRNITESRDLNGSVQYETMRAKNWTLTDAQARSLFGDTPDELSDLFRVSVKVFAGCHLLCVLVPGGPGKECMVEITNDAPYSVEHHWKKAWIPLLGWVDWPFTTTVPVGDPRSYHCEVWVPAGVEINPRSTGLAPTSPVPLTGRLGRCCYHLAAHNFAPGRDYELRLKFRGQLLGWLFATLVTCLTVLALLLTGSSLAAELVDAKTAKTGATGSTTPALNLTVLLTTIFLAVGAAAVTILAKSSTKSHALEDKMLAGVRVVAWCIPLVCFSASLILLSANTRACMALGFHVLIVIQWCLFVLILLPYMIRASRSVITRMR
ncbi:hypothetical protein HHX38_15590 [Streptomyces sp. PKU-MA01144]|uniref:hypothetical protein n=1 Tax=Streptomyces sp. PKU-MA01144 TaxID=2729138 RepID=UPI0014819EDD|nr:hypothetical protein [Streptomyces sp. PKU-MA01144]NNJ05549.1 hypothetical protein [Streptomyces sp. PKU-MA01144]